MIGAGRLPGQFYERDCLTRQIQVQLDGAAGASNPAWGLEQFQLTGRFEPGVLGGVRVLG
jgi:hypothetical protein